MLGAKLSKGAEDARKGITGASDLVEAGQKLAKAALSIINAWSWV